MRRDVSKLLEPSSILISENLGTGRPPDARNLCQNDFLI
jgi:hypothetical protein